MCVPERGEACDCVLFDLDGTLYSSAEYSARLDEEIRTVVSGFLGIKQQEARLLLQVGKKRFGTLTGTLENLKIDRELFSQEIANRIDPHKYLTPDHTLTDVLNRLTNQGLKIGLVSNSGRPLVEKILSAIGLTPEQFDVVVTSSDAKPKPSPEPFLLAISKIGSNLESSVYVGDRDEQELRPAKELGIKTILLDPSGGATAKWADHVVRNLTELPELMNSLKP